MRKRSGTFRKLGGVMVAVAAGLSACGDDAATDSGTFDAAVADGAIRDAWVVDGGAMDGPGRDGGMVDASTDGGDGDAMDGAADAGATDAAADAGAMDGAALDGGVTDAGAPVYNYAFISPVPRSGALGGLSGADALCDGWAAAAGLGGSYRAILSTTTVNARDRLAGARGWIRPDGRPVGDLPAGLFTTPWVFAPLPIDPGGIDVGDVRVWTASRQVGTFTTTAGAADCDGWTSADASDRAWIGSALSVPAWIDRETTASCAALYHFYCFQVDHDTPISVTDFAEISSLITDARSEVTVIRADFLVGKRKPGAKPALEFRPWRWSGADGIGQPIQYFQPLLFTESHTGSGTHRLALRVPAAAHKLQNVPSIAGSSPLLPRPLVFCLPYAFASINLTWVSVTIGSD